MEQLQLTATQILSLFSDCDFEARTSFASQIADAVESGEISALQAHMQMKSFEDIMTMLTETSDKKNKNFALAVRYRKELLDQAQQYGKEFSLHNAKFSVKEVGTKYDFSVSNDTKIAELKQELEALNLKIKERENFLKNLPESGVDEVNDDGEVIKLYRPLKTSTTAVSVSLK
jgi:hypothetical protein